MCALMTYIWYIITYMTCNMSQNVVDWVVSYVDFSFCCNTFNPIDFSLEQTSDLMKLSVEHHAPTFTSFIYTVTSFIVLVPLTTPGNFSAFYDVINVKLCRNMVMCSSSSLVSIWTWPQSTEERFCLRLRLACRDVNIF